MLAFFLSGRRLFDTYREHARHSCIATFEQLPAVLENRADGRVKSVRLMTALGSANAKKRASQTATHTIWGNLPYQSYPNYKGVLCKNEKSRIWDFLNLPKNRHRVRIKGLHLYQTLRSTFYILFCIAPHDTTPP